MSFRVSGSVLATGKAGPSGTERACPSASPRALPKPEISRRVRLAATDGYGFVAKLFKLGRLTGRFGL